MVEVEALRGADMVHAVRGRLRLKLARGSAAPAQMETVRAALAPIAGVETVELRPASASVIVLYDPGEHDALEAFLATQPLRHLPPVTDPSSTAPKPRSKGAGVPDLGNPGRRRPPPNKIAEATEQIEQEAEFLAEHSHAAKVVVEFCKDIDRKLKQATNNNIDLKILAPVGLAAVTFFEIGAAAATPMWVTLVLFSMNHFVELHAHDADEEDEDEPERAVAEPAE